VLNIKNPYTIGAGVFIYQPPNLSAESPKFARAGGTPARNFSLSAELKILLSLLQSLASMEVMQ